MTLDFENYLSPFTWRYGSTEMRKIWSEANKRRIWRRLWVVLAETQAEFGLVRAEQVDNLREYMHQIDIPRALEIEAEIHHDLMAEIKAFAEQAPLGGGILHLGATSADIEDNADVLRLRESLELVQERLRNLLAVFAEKVELLAEVPVIAFTHIQPAEPTTLGYRLAQYAQDLFTDWIEVQRVRQNLHGKGFKGATGTSASYAELLGVDQLDRFEKRLSERLGLPFYPVATQVYPRKQDYQVISVLAGLGGSIYKFAFDLRILQSAPIGELSEPYAKAQVGSSSMPFKRNPVNAEKINSLARWLAQMPRLAWDNAAHSLLERTLDDSANRRVMFPEAFLIADELLIVTGRILEGLQINTHAMQHNLAIFEPFAAVERLLMVLGKAGADRQAMHERLRLHAMAAWQDLQMGKPNPLKELVQKDEQILSYLSADAIYTAMDASQHLGNAPELARRFAAILRSEIGSNQASPTG